MLKDGLRLVLLDRLGPGGKDRNKTISQKGMVREREGHRKDSHHVENIVHDGSSKLEIEVLEGRRGRRSAAGPLSLFRIEANELTDSTRCLVTLWEGRRLVSEGLPKRCKER